MQKGIWLIHLLQMILRGDVAVKDALLFGAARYQLKPTGFTFQGIRFERADHIMWSIVADIFINRVYTPVGMDIQPNDVIVDIGAHRGGFVAYAARLTANKVLAFEPNADNYASLVSLVQTNNLRNVTIHNVAVGSRTGMAVLNLSSSHSRHTLRTRETMRGESPTGFVQVKVKSLDECLADVKVIHFLKMDCEGAENEILLNASDTTLSKIRRLVAETHEPFDSQGIIQLCEHLKKYFSRLVLINQNQQDLGYLYAWSENELK
jgi:FkbM family methyltransferase